MYYLCFILYISIILSVSTWVFISFFPFTQAHFVFFFELLGVDGVRGILCLGDLWTGSFSNVIDIVQVVLVIVFIVIMFFFIIRIIVLSMVI